ncbi:MAG TPA: terminase family protein [Pseudolabrys sp.]|nr:terminase family protein [Pseudolabrys sp.]
MTTPFPTTRTSIAQNLLDALKTLWLHDTALAEFLLKEKLHWIKHVGADFRLFAHAHQRPPAQADSGREWKIWLLLGGRGAGKTRAGAEWVRATALNDPKARIAIVGETEHDAREVMVEGISGILSVHRDKERPDWISSRRRLEWRNGAIAQTFSADEPASLRGPQFSAAWCDELAKWRHAEATFDMLQFGLRLGKRPRQVITTTPRPISLLKRLIADPDTVVTRARTSANAGNLAPNFLETIVARYAGTRLGRQEIDGEIVEERSDALWSRAGLERCRVRSAPELARIVVAIDPPGSARKGSDACGLVAAGCDPSGSIYVLADASAAGLSPQAWATKAVTLWRRLNADTLVAETNFGGEMVRAVIGAVDRNIPLTTVRATRGKYLRAEPVAQLYEQGRVMHVGAFPELEDEMCDFGRDGLSTGRSPDRLDALVWAVSALTFGARSEPRVRVV